MTFDIHGHSPAGGVHERETGVPGPGRLEYCPVEVVSKATWRMSAILRKTGDLFAEGLPVALVADPQVRL